MWCWRGFGWSSWLAFYDPSLQVAPPPTETKTADLETSMQQVSFAPGPLLVRCCSPRWASLWTHHLPRRRTQSWVTRWAGLERGNAAWLVQQQKQLVLSKIVAVLSTLCAMALLLYLAQWWAYTFGSCIGTLISKAVWCLMKTYNKGTRATLHELVSCKVDKWGQTCFRERFLAAMDS